MDFDYFLTPKKFFLRGNCTQQKVIKNFVLCGSFKINFFGGSKSSQNASIFHEKNDGVKKYPGCPYTTIPEVSKIPKVLISEV